jgi:hypothetical protein
MKRSSKIRRKDGKNIEEKSKQVEKRANADDLFNKLLQSSTLL